MTIFLLTFVILLIIVAAMSIGVILAKKPIAGSCGGMSALGIDTACDICGGDKNKCEKEQEQQSAKNDAAETDLSYDATSVANK
ncbi:hypothetical protein TDB9533_02003 [Thalassocella blandensis]|nr:hypothetical protein TDB9533_02003 [Thalassocella blandensis]